MHRVCGNVYVLADELDGNDHEIMDVLHVFTNATFREILGSAIADDNVTRCTTSDLVSDVAGQAKLAVVPSDFDLQMLSAAVP